MDDTCQCPHCGTVFDRRAEPVFDVAACSICAMQRVTMAVYLATVDDDEEDEEGP